MFTYIKLKNFKSLVDFECDFRDDKKEPKKLILIYGENGIGKSNFVSSFFTLFDILNTKSNKEKLEEFISNTESDEIKEIDKFINNLIKLKESKDIKNIIDENKSVNSEGNMILEFGFLLNEKEGNYKIETNNKQIVKEELNFVVKDKMERLFKIDDDKINLENIIFTDSEYFKEIYSLAEQYWGKHSILALIYAEIKDKKEGYVKDKLYSEFYSIIKYFSDVAVKLKEGTRLEKGKFGAPNKIFANLEKGEVDSGSEIQLKKVETILDTYFTHLYSDIKSVYYNIAPNQNNNKKEYTLMIKKKIYGEIVDLEFSKESTGTQHLLGLLPFFMLGVNGNNVILDEVDTGIHDILITNLLESLYFDIKGQIIMTTHNTILIQSEYIDKKFIYIFNMDRIGKKNLICLDDFKDLKVHRSLRDLYLSGVYGGIPDTMEIDFNEFTEIMEEE